MNPTECSRKGLQNANTVPNLDFVPCSSRHVFHFPRVLALPTLLHLIIIESSTQVCLEKAAGPCSEYLLSQLLPHFSPAGVRLPFLAVKLSSSGQPFVPVMDQSPPSVPAPDQAPADSPPAWLSPLSMTPEERPALLRVPTGPYRNSQRSTPTQIADALVPFAVNKQPHYTI